MTGSGPVTKDSGSAVRILHITFNMGIGGTEQVIRQLVCSLPAHRFSNTILCIDGQVGEIGQQVRAQGVNVMSVKRSPGLDFNLVRAIRKIIRETGADLVHCHQYTPWVYGWLGSRGTKARVVFTEHGRFHPDRFRFKAMLINPVMALATNAIVAISDATRSALSRYEFIPKSRIRVIYNGISGFNRTSCSADSVRQELDISADHFVIGTVARLDPIKNQEMMLIALPHILKHCPDICLMIVGDGPDRGKLERRAIELGVQKNVRFTGFRPHPADYLAAMDLFLLTSHTEGTSMTLLEAMSLGVPSVVTAVGGNPEIVQQDKTGILIPAGDSKALAASVVRLYREPVELQAMRVRCERLFSERFSIKPMILEYQNLYSRVLKG